MAESADHGTFTPQKLREHLKNFVEGVEELCDDSLSADTEGLQQRLYKVLPDIGDDIDVRDSGWLELYNAVECGARLVDNAIELFDPVQPMSGLSTTKKQRLSSDLNEFNHRKEALKNKKCPGNAYPYNVQKTFIKFLDSVAGKMSKKLQSKNIFPQARTEGKQDTDKQEITDSDKMKRNMQRSKRFCKSCENVKEAAIWELVTPSEICKEEGIEQYQMELSAGKYECTETGLRLECSCTVTLQYHFSNWEPLNDFLKKEKVEACGPLMDIIIISGHPDVIHLPHCICLGSDPDLWGNMYVLKKHHGVDLEECELTRFHAKRLHRDLCKMGVVIKRNRLPKFHYKTRIYLARPELRFHVHLLPLFSPVWRSVKKKELSAGAVYIRKPGPDDPFRLGKSYSLKTSCDSRITPMKRELIYGSCNSASFEVHVKDVNGDFHMKFTDTSGMLWETTIQEADYAVNPSSAESQRFCKTCETVKDSLDWTLTEPKVISCKPGATKFEMSLLPGKYECAMTRLRMECTCKVTLQYQYSNWDLLNEYLETHDLEPCGPLVDINIKSGEIKSIHLPHFICLGSDPGLHVNILHKDSSKVDLEECELTRFHAKRLYCNLSMIGAVIKKMLFLEVHCETMIYRVRTARVQFRIYLFPCDNRMIKLVAAQEESRGVQILKPSPEAALRWEKPYRLTTDCSSDINPEMADTLKHFQHMVLSLWINTEKVSSRG